MTRSPNKYSFILDILDSFIHTILYNSNEKEVKDQKFLSFFKHYRPKNISGFGKIGVFQDLSKRTVKSIKNIHMFQPKYFKGNREKLKTNSKNQIIQSEFETANSLA